MPIPYAAMLAVPAIAQGAKTLFTGLNKPKKPQNTEMMTVLDRQISNNQADIVNKTLMNNLTRNAKSIGSSMYQQAQRNLGVMRNTGELSEGQYAQGMLSAATGIQSQVGEQSENAMLAQQQQNLQMQDRVNNARLQYAQLKDQARQQYESDKLQWSNEMVGGLIDTATSTFGAIKNGMIAGKVNEFLAGRNIADLKADEMDSFYNYLIALRSGVGW